MIKVLIGTILIIGSLVGFGVNALVTGRNNSIAYDSCCGGYFDSADRASDLPTKIAFFQKYIAGLEAEGLTDGCNSVYDCGRPAANNAVQYEVAKSLLSRMQNATNLTGVDKAFEINQITNIEFCWFPDNAFAQAYQLKHGNWGAAMFAPSQTNNCSKPTSSSSSSIGVAGGN